MCGEGVAERLWLGFQAIDKAAQLIAQNDSQLGVPAPDMLLRHLNAKGAPPAWLTEVKTLYTNAMNEMYRANIRAREASRCLIRLPRFAESHPGREVKQSIGLRSWRQRFEALLDAAAHASITSDVAIVLRLL